ncbi:MAG: hypothetical protein ACD_24C00387G0001 [uncultured bacterium]|nr:MAG: hypothetical protein ACD_24C00387G0001 [uncultured bacterium]
MFPGVPVTPAFIPDWKSSSTWAAISPESKQLLKDTLFIPISFAKSGNVARSKPLFDGVTSNILLVIFQNPSLPANL